MAKTKAKTSDQVVPLRCVQTCVGADGIERPYLSREHLYEAEMIGFEIASYREGARARLAEAARLEQETALRVGQLRQEAQFFQRKQQEAGDRHKRLFDRLGQLYGLDFKHALYDSETGIITVDFDQQTAATRQQARAAKAINKEKD
jgi:hypothetical protein